MPSPFRILEILIYSLIAFLPYVLLVVYPFRSSLRFGSTSTAIIASFAAILQLACDLAIAVGLFGNSSILKIGVLVIHILLCLVLVHADWGKKLFILLTTINIAVVISSAASLISGALFPAQEPRQFTWAGLIVMLLFQILLLVPYVVLILNRLSAAMQGPNSVWSFLWLLPAVVTAAWACLSMIGLPAAVPVLVTAVLTIVILLLSMTFLRSGASSEPAPQRQRVQKPVRKPMSERAYAAEQEPAKSAPKAAAKRAAPAPKPAAPAPQPVPAAQPEVRKPAAQNVSCDPSLLQTLQRDNLLERIAESDQFHRELLRHVEAMAYRLDRKQYDKLQLHVNSLHDQLSGETQAQHCQNSELNAVIAYFTRMAGYCGAQVTTNLQVTDNPAVPTRDLTVVLGNLLDNALNVCKKQNGFDRRIYAAVRMNGSAMYLTVENTYDTPVQKNELCLDVCKQIAERYNGILELSDVNGVFKATAILRV